MNYILYIFTATFLISFVSLFFGLIFPKKVYLWKLEKTRTNVIKIYVWSMFISLILVGVIGAILDISKRDKKQEGKIPTNTKKIQIQKNETTLKNYKTLSVKNKEDIILSTIKSNKLDIKLSKYYLNCMGDFAYQKSEQLLYKEVFEWCDNERKNNIRKFYSHINELEYRKNGNYDIQQMKKKQLEIATEIAIKEQEKSLNNQKNKNIKKLKTAKEAMEQFGGLYTVKEISKNEIILYSEYYPLDDSKIILEQAKRNFIDAIYISFIKTNLQELKIGIIPINNEDKNKHKFSFKSSIKRVDALKVAQNILQINKLSDLTGGDYGVPNEIYNRARFNDQGRPTLDVFFQELSKYTY